MQFTHKTESNFYCNTSLSYFLTSGRMTLQLSVSPESTLVLLVSLHISAVGSGNPSLAQCSIASVVDEGSGTQRVTSLVNLL
jgi:hypothetical protein